MIELEISFKHELYEQHDAAEQRMVVYYKRPLMMGGRRKLYKNRIFVTGEIDKIREVKYIFHHSFPNPIRTVIDRNTKFELIFWAWEEGFTMNIVVADTDGDLHNYRHPIRLFDLVKKAEAQKLTKEYKFYQISPR
jgi:hypothetical protein